MLDGNELEIWLVLEHSELCNSGVLFDGDVTSCIEGETPEIILTAIALINYTHAVRHDEAIAHECTASGQYEGFISLG